MAERALRRLSFLAAVAAEGSGGGSNALFRSLTIPLAHLVALDLDADASADTSAWCNGCTTFPVPTPLAEFRKPPLTEALPPLMAFADPATNPP